MSKYFWMVVSALLGVLAMALAFFRKGAEVSTTFIEGEKDRVVREMNKKRFQEETRYEKKVKKLLSRSKELERRSKALDAKIKEKWGDE